MKPLWSSPCSRAGLSSRDDPFPCLRAEWGERDCPMNAAQGRSLREGESALYRLGYGYGAWVVRLDVLGLGPVCTLVYFREKPTAEALGELYGGRVLRLSDATPRVPPGGVKPLDLEVLADAAH